VYPQTAYQKEMPMESRLVSLKAILMEYQKVLLHLEFRLGLHSEFLKVFPQMAMRSDYVMENHLETLTDSQMVSLMVYPLKESH